MAIAAVAFTILHFPQVFASIFLAKQVFLSPHHSVVLWPWWFTMALGVGQGSSETVRNPVSLLQNPDGNHETICMSAQRQVASCNLFSFLNALLLCIPGAVLCQQQHRTQCSNCLTTGKQRLTEHSSTCHMCVKVETLAGPNRQSPVFNERGQLSQAIPQLHVEQMLHE